MRPLKKTDITADELTEVASNQTFTLYKRVGKDGETWRNLKLIRFGKAPKQCWWFGWNGERLSITRDSELLREHNPKIYEWVVQTLANHMAG